MRKLIFLFVIGFVAYQGYLWNCDNCKNSKSAFCYFCPKPAEPLPPTWRGAVWLDVSGSRTKTCVPYEEIERNMKTIIALIQEKTIGKQAAVLEFGLIDSYSDDRPPVRLELLNIKRPKRGENMGTTVSRAKQRKAYQEALVLYQKDSIARTNTMSEFQEKLKILIEPYKTKSSHRTDLWGAFNVSETFFQEQLIAAFNPITDNYLFLITDAQHTQKRASYSPMASFPTVYLINCADNASDNRENSLDEEEVDYERVVSLENAIKLSFEKSK
ncbi:MAG: hypothetical protein COB67_09620 [SAR324 cluster bacterium]|uniref:Uncharacterized protein n=1 Tax=SAR324 cluster bacterium TaxID=2024889 RepID=A0A2A4T0L1_9DELT|nr:MAG: hypothetical protein COB67_09620 [SAR324 cluster bacterium]